MSLKTLGRPPLHGERMVLMPIYLTAEQRDFLATLSAARGCSAAVLVREAVDSFMTARLSPTPPPEGSL